MTQKFEHYSLEPGEQNEGEADEPREILEAHENAATETFLKNALNEGEKLHTRYAEQQKPLSALIEKNRLAGDKEKIEIEQTKTRVDGIRAKERKAFLDFKSIMLSLMTGYAVLTYDFNALSRLLPEGKKAHAAEMLKKEKGENAAPPYEEISYLKPEEMRVLALSEKTEEVFFCFPEKKSCIRPAQVREIASGKLAEGFSFETLEQIMKEKNVSTYEFVHTHPIEAVRTLQADLITENGIESFSYSESAVNRMREKTPPPLPPSVLDFISLVSQKEKVGGSSKGIVYESTGIWRFAVNENSDGYKNLKNMLAILQKVEDIDRPGQPKKIWDLIESNPEFDEVIKLDAAISEIQLNILISFRKDVRPDQIYELIEQYRKHCEKFGIDVTYQPFSGSDFGESTEELQKHHMPAHSPYPPSK